MCVVLNRDNDHRYPINEPHVQFGNEACRVQTVSVNLPNGCIIEFEKHDYHISHLPWLKDVVPEVLCRTYSAKEPNRCVAM